MNLSANSSRSVNLARAPSSSVNGSASPPQQDPPEKPPVLDLITTPPGPGANSLFWLSQPESWLSTNSPSDDSWQM